VRLIEAVPDLGAELPPAERELAHAALVVRTIALTPGPWMPEQDLRGHEGDLGVLLLEGLLLRDVEIMHTTCAELVGAGDLLRPWDDVNTGAPVPSEVVWHVISPATLALLDHRAVAIAGRWPELMSALVGRAVSRAQTLALALAISSITGLKLRLLVLLWHLADRFGKVGRDGVSVPVPLTHRSLARLVGASRPSVSTAMKELENEGRVAKLLDPGRGFLLLGEPPELLTALRHPASATGAPSARRGTLGRREGS
jgi:hypothetical protein